MNPTIAAESRAALDFLDRLFAAAPLRAVGVRLWDGTPWPDASHRAATLVLKHPGALRRMFGAGTERALAEAYLHDDFDIEGDLESAFELADALAERPGWIRSWALAYRLRRLPAAPRTAGGPRSRSFRAALRRHSPERDREAIRFHYDVSNDFYRLWLDEQMVYSCAYFASPDLGLEAAQTAKLDYLCRKLRMRRDQRVLDIGCGWGGLALHAARHYGVEVTGVTLSEAQARLATARAAKAGLAARVKIECRDYRSLCGHEPFDAAVSVGMSEHVGADHQDEYFQTVWRLIKPTGVFLNHAIGEGCRYRPTAGPSFIEAYVFPDSDIPPIHAVLAAAASAGFEVRDVENLREHYARTLRCWVDRLEARHAEALEFVTEAAYRVWRLYMAASARGFACGRLAIYQALLVKPDEAGRAGLPPTRRDWYDPGAVGAAL